MHGARQLAWHYLKPRVKGMDVVDLCCGDGWLQEKCIKDALPGERAKSWRGFDLRTNWNALVPGQWEDITFFDVAVTVYGFLTLTTQEARAWLLLREQMGPNSRFVYIGRHKNQCGVESNRQDPINGYCAESFRGLALATGFTVVDWREYCYVETAFRDAQPGEANAFAATLELS